jgi:hypothetical protein
MRRLQAPERDWAEIRGFSPAASLLLNLLIDKKLRFRPSGDRSAAADIIRREASDSSVRARFVIVLQEQAPWPRKIIVNGSPTQL